MFVALKSINVSAIYLILIIIMQFLFITFTPVTCQKPFTTILNVQTTKKVIEQGLLILSTKSED